MKPLTFHTACARRTFLFFSWRGHHDLALSLDERPISDIRPKC